MKLWLYRDKDGYNLSSKRLVWENRFEIWVPKEGDQPSVFEFDLCPKVFHRTTSIRLAPGDGPVRVDVTVTRVEE